MFGFETGRSGSPGSEAKPSRWGFLKKDKPANPKKGRPTGKTSRVSQPVVPQPLEVDEPADFLDLEPLVDEPPLAEAPVPVCPLTIPAGRFDDRGVNIHESTTLVSPSVPLRRLSATPAASSEVLTTPDTTSPQPEGLVSHEAALQPLNEEQFFAQLDAYLATAGVRVKPAGARRASVVETVASSQSRSSEVAPIQPTAAPSAEVVAAPAAAAIAEAVLAQVSRPPQTAERRAVELAAQELQGAQQHNHERIQLLERLLAQVPLEQQSTFDLRRARQAGGLENYAHELRQIERRRAEHRTGGTDLAIERMVEQVLQRMQDYVTRQIGEERLRQASWRDQRDPARLLKRAAPYLGAEQADALLERSSRQGWSGDQLREAVLQAMGSQELQRQATQARLAREAPARPPVSSRPTGERLITPSLVPPELRGEAAPLDERQRLDAFATILRTTYSQLDTLRYGNTTHKADEFTPIEQQYGGSINALINAKLEQYRTYPNPGDRVQQDLAPLLRRMTELLAEAQRQAERTSAEDWRRSLTLRPQKSRFIAPKRVTEPPLAWPTSERPSPTRQP